MQKELLELKNKMTPDEYKQFRDMRLFTIRRTNRFWSGTWSDMVIEQSLMRQIKTRGGLIHGRGTTDISLNKWISSIPYCIKIGKNISFKTTINGFFNKCEHVEDFLRLKRYSSSQHKDLSDSRLIRDNHDQDLLIEFFRDHNPFSVGDEKGLYSISTGVVAGDDINCHDAEGVGLRIISRIVGENFEDVKLKRNDKVKTLNPHSIKIRNESIAVDPRPFNRILCTVTSSEQLENCFSYELSTEATSLFKDSMMRKTQKSALFNIFEKLLVKYLNENEAITPDGRLNHFIDGGFLLHNLS